MTMPREIRTDRLLLRPLKEADAQAIADLMSFEVVQYLTSVPYPNTLENIQVFLKEVAGERGLYGVVLGGQFAGVVGGSTMLGYWYGEPFWGKGLASEAAFAYRDAWFAHTDAPFLRSGFAPPNLASARVLEKLGMQTEGFSCATLNRTRAPTLLHHVALSRAKWQALTAGGDPSKRQA